MTSIGYYAFGGCRSLNSLTIPDSVTSIGKGAFQECINLASVTIPVSITSISDNAFFECNGLTAVSIPDSVTSLGAGAFCKCGSLKNIAIPDSVTSIGEAAFSDCNSLESIAIPDSVTNISNHTFVSCSNLTSITIPGSVTDIGNCAFYECTNLTSITIPNSVTSIGNLAFYKCENLKDVTIPESVTDIGEYAFKGTKWLSEYPDDFVVLKNGILIAYKGKDSVISIPDLVTSICNSVFAKCNNLTSVTIPDSVTSISDSAFESCSNLTSVTIPNSVTSIGDSAFEGCNFSSFTVPKTVRKVGKSSFCQCKEITVYDSIDPDAKPCKSHSDKYGGSPNSLLGSIVNYKTHDNWLDYEVTVRSAQTDEIKYKVWMGADRTQGEYCYTLASSWGRNATFNFNAVDEFFPKIKGVYHKIKVAMNRLRYPVDLTDEQKEMYRSYIVHSAKNAVKLCIDTDDIELLLSCKPLGIIKKNNIDELLEYATEKKAVSFTAYLLEYKESHFKKGKNVLDSLKL